MAEVIHRYVRDPQAVAEKAAEREAAEKRRQEAVERKKAAKTSCFSFDVEREWPTLRREKKLHSRRTKRLEREMEIAAQAGRVDRKSGRRETSGFLARGDASALYVSAIRMVTTTDWVSTTRE